MLTAINWEPFVIGIEVFMAFVVICFLATLSDLWAKGARKPARRTQPIANINGEKVYLN